MLSRHRHIVQVLYSTTSSYRECHGLRLAVRRNVCSSLLNITLLLLGQLVWIEPCTNVIRKAVSSFNRLEPTEDGRVSCQMIDPSLE